MQELTENKTENVLIKNELNKLKTFDSVSVNNNSASKFFLVKL